MSIYPFGQSINVEELKLALIEASASELSVLFRNWLLRFPSFSEFDGLYRYIKQEDIFKNIEEKYSRTENWLVIGGYSTRPVAASLSASLIACGKCPSVFESNFGAFQVDCLSPDSEMYEERFHHILICSGSHHFPVWPCPGSSTEEVDSALESVWHYFSSRWNKIKELTDARIHQHSVLLPTERIIGRFDKKYYWGCQSFINIFNNRLWSSDGRLLDVVDLETLQDYNGFEGLWSSKWFHHGKLPFRPKAISKYAIQLYSHLSSVYGVSRRCIVVDLDNTLWGGIVGDVGVLGLEFGQGSARGEAFLQFCNTLKLLKNHGIILAAISKNNEVLASEVFDKHPEMPLLKDDFSILKINWKSKVVNLQEVLKALNLSQDSIVFIDDNPVECAEILSAFPSCLVLQVAEDNYCMSEELIRLNLFSQSSLTKDDLQRNESYKAIKMVTESSQASSNNEEFLNSLEMKASTSEMKKDEIPRIAQLFSKTNQFNVTGIKFSESELSNLSKNEFLVLNYRLKDKFSNYGLVSSIVITCNGPDAELINWVMSCRVFNRTLEQFIAHDLYGKLVDKKVKKLFVCLRKTNQNGYINNLFPKLGFKRIKLQKNLIKYKITVDHLQKVISNISN
jgi:FkbH-like protein